MTIVRNGRVLDIRGHRAPPADILIAGDAIAEIGPPGLAAPADAIVVDATDRLIHPGLINAHTHGHGNLSKGMGDRWTLELLLTAAPWISGNRTAEDKYLSTYIGALEMLMKGCTACYDLTVEFPAADARGARCLRQGLRRRRHARGGGADGRRASPSTRPSPACSTRSPRPCRRTSSGCAWRPTRRASPPCATCWPTGASTASWYAPPSPRPSRTTAATSS